MIRVSVHEAKTNLSRLLRDVAAGKEVIITSNGKPVGALIPPPKPKKRVFGDLQHLAGQFSLPDNFNEPMPDEWFFNDPEDPLNRL